MKNWNPQYKTLDHWRGLAALWVIMFHSFATLYNKPVHPLSELVRSISGFGWLGVHMFFVISGYCITANVYQLISKKGNSWEFLKKRFWRLLPTYWMAIVFTIVISLLSSPFNKTSFWEAFPSSFESWIGNLFLIQPYINVPFYMIVSWSLVVELGFYLIVASLIVIRNRFNNKLAFCLALGLGFISIFIPIDPRLGLLRYWGEFLLGSLVFYSLINNANNKISQRNLSLFLIFVLGGIGQYINIVHGQQNQMLFSGLFAILIYFGYQLDDYFTSLEYLDWLKFVGIMSYSLYLLHVQVEGRVINLGSRFISSESPILLFLIVFSWLMAISISFLFYQSVEKPLNNLRHKIFAHKSS